MHVFLILKFYLFADDTNLLYADKNLRALENKVNAELSKIYDWLIANKLSLNTKKSNFVIFQPRQKILSYQVNFKVFDHHTNSYISLNEEPKRTKKAHFAQMQQK